MRIAKLLPHFLMRVSITYNRRYIRMYIRYFLDSATVNYTGYPCRAAAYQSWGQSVVPACAGTSNLENIVAVLVESPKVRFGVRMRLPLTPASWQSHYDSGKDRRSRAGGNLEPLDRRSFLNRQLHPLYHKQNAIALDASLFAKRVSEHL